MVLDLIITKTNDGCTAEIPSLKGCESWAHQEEDAISKAIELLKFYTNLNDKSEIIIDKARRHNNKTIYKVIFNKSLQ